ncbi:MAG: O-antigen ligase family protein [Acidobacteriota bacterium]
MSRDRRWAESLFSPISIAALACAVFVALSTAFSRDPAYSVRHLAGVSLLLLIPITMDLVEDVGRARAVVLAIAASGVVLAFAGFWEFTHGGDDLYRRLQGGLSHWMTYAGLTMIAACLLAGFALEDRGRWRMAGALAVLPFAAMVLTFTRNAYVGAIAAAVSYLIVRRPRGVLFLAPALVALFLIVPGSVRARFVSIGDLRDGSNWDRVLMVRAGMRMVADSPVFGIGPDEVRPLYPFYRDAEARDWNVPHLHNNVVQIAAANGLFACAAYLALMGIFFVHTAGALRRETEPARAALLAGAWLSGVALFVAGLFEYNFGDTEIEMATLLILAIPFSKALAGRESGAERPKGARRPRYSAVNQIGNRRHESKDGTLSGGSPLSL